MSAELPNPSDASDSKPLFSVADPRVLRTLDASLNRAAEGLRVVEDYARFIRDDALLTEQLKRLRHGLAELGRVFPWQDRLALRETASDVGVSISTLSETCRASAEEVCIASLERSQQALRSLEEFAKTVDGAPSAGFERLRYETYQIAKAIAAGQRGSDRLASARLYVILDGSGSLADFSALVTSLCQAGVGVVQLREKGLCDRALVCFARAMVTAAADFPTLTIVNDRPDLAVLAGADGVHVGQEELSVHDARAIVGPQRLIGVSTHNVEQLKQAVKSGADYVGLGPTFPSKTKRFESFAGLDFLREAAVTTSLPAYAIGGITEENLADVLATGAQRIAVSAAVTGSAEPAEAARRLLKQLAVR
ncbi:thiamine phosphate synthase [Botrimarina hoheduenensis]|uniref:Thiamine-phosphate synthase n=1 Tax=Botrimarina hoheduenensis TaxID=2528000 RepID=A0A5C5WDX5_9BACT|nr:thiamine phosphate synthase [Botrimarina hoheduenensis]TWT48353.1 Thiamine-phosphate synthase [Botrimarina hoheduenensis]